MRLVAIDPGTRNTGLVWMSESRVLDAETVSFSEACGQDQDALRTRCRAITSRVAAWMAERPHDLAVIEGFTGFASGRRGAFAFQTPFLVGYLIAALPSERFELQTSADVLNPSRRGNCAWAKRRTAAGDEVMPGALQCTNDHERSALAHGMWRLGIGEP